jgi:hypothetical protein
MVFPLKGGCAIMRSTIRNLTCLIILTALPGLEDHLGAARTGTVVFSAESAVPAIMATKRPLANTLVWDTVFPFGNKVDLRDRTNWKVVPADLLTLELDPPAAISDPAYYGREYSFQGDAVIENEHLIAVFWSRKGRVVIYSTADLTEKRVELIPLQLKGRSASITYSRVLQNTGDDAALEISFSAKESQDNYSAIFSFDRKQIVEIKPAGDMNGMRLLSPIEYGVVPGFISDDLIFDPRAYPSLSTLHVPSDNLFLGLLKGQNNMLVITWPKGKQHMRLVLGQKEAEPRLIESVDFDNDGKSFYVALLDAPGIWHKEELKPSFLERDVPVNWKRPFPAKWKTQLLEAGVRTTYNFRQSKDNIWRAITGHYTYPVWFEGDSAFYHLSKKIPPIGESVIYFLERQGTPISVCTPVDILKETLGRQACDTILDIAGRKLRTHHRRGGQGIRRAATCGCTAAMQVVFEARREVEEQDYVAGAVDDMVYFVTGHVERIGEYRAFAHDMMSFLNLKSESNPDLEPFLNSMKAITQQILQEYSTQQENIKTLAYAAELARQTKALTRQKNPQNLPTYLALGEQWRTMGGAQDELIARFHSITRKLFQAAGYSCVNEREALEMAQEVRSRCRQCLRNADGYEIWPNY